MSDLLLPPPLASDERYQVLGTIAARLSDIDITPVLVYLVDTVDASALPLLADQFHILGEGWQFARTEADQRQLLKRAIELHRYKGTRWAVQQALETRELSGQISEWFEYGGSPYHFRVTLDVSNTGIDRDRLIAALTLIDEFKNVRSFLELLRVHVESSVDILVGALPVIIPRYVCRPYQPAVPSTTTEAILGGLPRIAATHRVSAL